MYKIRVALVMLLTPMHEDRGSVATEYGLTLMLIALAIIAAATAFGLAVTGLFDRGVTAFPAGS